MPYIVAQYYIGPFNRYDGTGNTDKASIFLFNDRDIAVKFILKQIQQIIDEIISDNSDKFPQIFDDMANFTEAIDKYNMYNYSDTHMFTLEKSKIVTSI